MKKSSSARVTEQRESNERLWDWRAALLAIALMEISSSRLVITKWVSFLYFTQTIVFFGILLGFALGYSYFSRKAVIRLAIGYTLILLPAQLLKAVERTDWLWQDLLVLFMRFFVSLGQFFKNQPVYDQLFFITLVTFGYWMIGLCAGYWLTRHRDFPAGILPAGAAMLIVQIFDPFEAIRMWGLALYIFVALLLLGRMYFLENHARWTRTHFLLSPKTITDLERGALAVAAVAVFVSWSLPRWISSIRPAAQAWNNFSQPIIDRLSDAVTALESPYGKESSGDFYGSELALGNRAAAGDTPVFFVKVKESEFVPIRNYWKGRVYDLYINGHWTETAGAGEEYRSDVDEVTVEYPELRHEMEFTFTNNIPSQRLLYAPAEAIWISRDGKISSLAASPAVRDVHAWVADPALLIGNQYQVRALIADPSIEELRLAGVQYPAWVTDRYLQIPENIAPQLEALALEITAPYDTPYDKAQAITQYLREEIEYEEKISSVPPENKDPLLWVLFEHKKGFCTYYASAETLMLRSIGIPARMAVGFAQGEVDESKPEERYTVTYDNAHAWPEVYFPGIGWVEFEPTGNQAPLDRPEFKDNGIDQLPAPEAAQSPVPTPLPEVVIEEMPELIVEGGASATAIKQPISYSVIFNFVLILFLAALIVFTRRYYSLESRLTVYLASRYKKNGNRPPRWLDRWVRWAGLSSVERAFQAVNFSLFWLGHPQPAHITSQERVIVLTTHLPEVQEQALLLLQEYQSTMYTRRAGNPAIARRAAILILLKTWQNQIKKTLNLLDTRYNQLR